MALRGNICVVTGASRGIGKGIALQLGEAGAKVYITGRTLENKDGTPGSLALTAKEIATRGGECVPVQCDHSKDDQVAALFKRVSEENSGRLDVLVNNAYAAVQTIMDTSGKGFYEIPFTVWDEVNNVGLRNHYVCAWHAAQLMVPRKSGLIVNISSVGGLRYFFNAAYGVGKAGCDRMAADCAIELKKQNVAFVSLWPGAVLTETIESNLGNMEGTAPELAKAFKEGESAEYAGKCVVSLAADKNVMTKTGKILISGDLGAEYGFKDVNGNAPASMRSLSNILRHTGHTWLSAVIPGWVKLPGVVFNAGSSKF